MNLQDLKYLIAIAEQQHFGRAADACNVAQPTLSNQIRKLEKSLGVTLLERTSKRVSLTHVGVQILERARAALHQTQEIESIAQSARDPLVGPLRLGVIPTLAPYLMPLILRPLRKQYPGLALELWEDQTHALVEGLRTRQLDAALLATPAEASETTEIALFREPLLAALPQDHALAGASTLDETTLADDLLVLAEGHCLASQALETCGASSIPGPIPRNAMQAGTLETLVNLVAAGYGTTLIPALAADSLRRLGIVILPLANNPYRTIRLASRPGFPRPQALRALEKVIRSAVCFAEPSKAPETGMVSPKRRAATGRPRGSQTVTTRVRGPQKAVENRPEIPPQNPK
ncbi:LysR family transcriptional regulator [Acidobacteria bacterium AB60]|nr:LysR family transcriptional regulator [Acidobacteria bacterium AB60]